MRVLTYTRPYYLSRLNDELAALPGLAPGTAVDPILGTVAVPRFILEGGAGGVIRLTVPDDADEAAIAAVIAAHDPTPPPPMPTQAEQLAGAIAAARAATSSVTTLDEMKAVVTQLYATLNAILLAGGQP